MNDSIVQQLANWLVLGGPRLSSIGIQLINRIPEHDSDKPWKATIGLVKDDIFVSYTVWERTIFQTELIIVNGATGETLVSEDSTPQTVDEIDGLLDSVVEGLIAGKYIERTLK